jgi:hypothetical protein
MEIFSGNKNKVIVSRDEVREFMASYPCSGLDSDRAYWFEFESNGDLVDTDVPEHSDGPGALALSKDAQRFWEDNR